MSTRLDVEEIQTTKGEKLLAVVLAVFLLIGGVWTYAKIDDAVRRSTPADFDYRGTAAEQAALARENQARRHVYQAQHAVNRTRSTLELRREAYRTALEAHRVEAAALGRAYDRARTRFASAQREAAAAQAEVARARPAADAAQKEISKVQRGRQDRRELLAFVFRLAFVLLNIVFGYWLMARLRRRGSRYYAVALALIGYGSILAFAMAVDYLTDYFHPLDLGPLVISLFGIVVTLLAFVGLQRYLARRIPHWRVRKGECPFCGYPARGNTHCERCGREVIAACARCSEPRRVGSAHCGACGAA